MNIKFNLICFILILQTISFSLIHNQTINLPCQKIISEHHILRHMVLVCKKSQKNIQYIYIDLFTFQMSNYSQILPYKNIYMITSARINTKTNGRLLLTNNYKVYYSKIPITSTSKMTLLFKTYSWIHQAVYQFRSEDFNHIIIKSYRAYSNLYIYDQQSFIQQHKVTIIYVSNTLVRSTHLMLLGEDPANTLNHKLLFFHITQRVTKFQKTIPYFNDIKMIECDRILFLLQNMRLVTKIEIVNYSEEIFVNLNQDIQEISCFTGIVVLKTFDRLLFYNSTDKTFINSYNITQQENFRLIKTQVTDVFCFCTLSNLSLTLWKLDFDQSFLIESQGINATEDNLIHNTTQNTTENTENQLTQQKSLKEIKNMLQNIAENIGTVLSVTSMKSSFKFIVPIYIFLDDLWMYNFHYNVSYPMLMDICMTEVDIITVTKNKPKYINFLDNLMSVKKTFPNNDKYLVYFKQGRTKNKGLDISEVYFLEASKDIFVFGMISNILVFSVFILMKKLIKLIYSKKMGSQFWKSVFNSFCQKTKMWVFISLIVESGFTRLCFYAFNQISWFIFFDFESKLNCVGTVSVLFFLIAYSITFYLITKRFHKKSSPNLLLFSKTIFKGFLLQSILYCFTKVLISFCHSNIIINHSLKLKTLIVVNIFQIFLCFSYRSYFLNKLTFFIYLLYHFCFLTLNFFVLVVQKNIFGVENKDIINMTILILVGIVGINILKEIVEILIDICKSMINNHKIQAQVKDDIKKTKKKQIQIVKAETDKTSQSRKQAKSQRGKTSTKVKRLKTNAFEKKRKEKNKSNQGIITKLNDLTENEKNQMIIKFSYTKKIK